MAPTIPTGFPHTVPVSDQPLAAWEGILIFFHMFSYNAQRHFLEFILSVTVTMKPILFYNLLFSLVIFFFAVSALTQDSSLIEDCTWINDEYLPAWNIDKDTYTAVTSYWCLLYMLDHFEGISKGPLIYSTFPSNNQTSPHCRSLFWMFTTLVFTALLRW